jgi:hypothetical protein
MSRRTPLRRRRRRSREEIERLLRAYDGSGQTQARFAEQHGIPLTTLHYWLRRRREDGSGECRPALVPVTLRPGIGGGGTRIEIALANGRELRVPVDMDVARIARLVTVLDS